MPVRETRDALSRLAAVVVLAGALPLWADTSAGLAAFKRATTPLRRRNGEPPRRRGKPKHSTISACYMPRAWE